MAPAASVFERGGNRYPFGVFTLAKKQVTDADVALYFAKDVGAPVEGPLPAEVVSLEAKPAYRALGSEESGDAKAVYVVPEVDFDRSGPWLAVAMLREDGELTATRPTQSPVVDSQPRVVDAGEQAPLIHTPTPTDVGGDLSQLTTRVPPDDMHQVDFADVVGKKPIALLFATPALCLSRVCGPVTDVAQQVSEEVGDSVEFIHMEVYDDNEMNKGIRPQLKAFGLQTEPWLFLIGEDGKVKERIEGAFGVEELRRKLEKILPA